MATLITVASLVAAGSDAQAQNIDLSTDQVTVDLSVIDDYRSTPVPAMPYVPRFSGSAPRQGLLLPGRKNPVSQLHIATPREGVRIKLKKPGTGTKKTAKRVARKAPKKTPRVKKPTVKKPAPPTVAAVEPPAPLSTASPAAVAPLLPEPEPKAAPAKQQAKSAPPPPAMKAAEKPVAAKAPAPAKPAAPASTVTAAMPKPKDAKKEQAAVSPAPKSTPTGRALQVVFDATASKLPAKSKKALKALALKLKSQDTLRLQLMAFAGGKSLSSSKARRMSLSRALSIRSFLIENGVRSTRIDVRALGSKTTEKPLNRVDINIVER
jgi:outer membrane protein OmpA-like peptidoglycan-associated protein